MRRCGPPTLTLVLVTALLCGAASMRLRTAQAAHPRARFGGLDCEPHTRYATACILSAGTFEDGVSPGGVNYYRITLPDSVQAIQITLERAENVQAVLIREATGLTGPLSGGDGGARPPYAVGAAGPAIPGEDRAGATPPTDIAPYPAPFLDTPFLDTPFLDTPFLVTPFLDTAAPGAAFRPFQAAAVTSGEGATKTLTHFADALDAPELHAANLVLAVWAPNQQSAGYSITVQILAGENVCRPGALAAPLLPGGFVTSGSAHPIVPEGATTAILTNESRWARYFGADGAATVGAQLAALAAAPGVRGVIVAVDADPLVAAAYADWDANPCAPSLANVTAARIKRVLDRLVVADPTIRYVVLASGDPILPFFRVPDDSRIANEGLYAGRSGQSPDSAGAAAFATHSLLTDDYYTACAGTLSGSGVLHTADLPIGPLVETPGDVTVAVQTFYRRAASFWRRRAWSPATTF